MMEPKVAPKWARRNLLVADWERIERALQLHSKECNRFADELNQRLGHPSSGADLMREESAETDKLLADLQIQAIKDLLS